MTLPQRISVSSALLSLITMTVCYIIAVNYGSVPLCIPWLQGCAAITETGITYPEAYFFRAGFISAGVLIIIWWYCMRAYLREIRAERWSHWLRVVFQSGILASILLIVSVTVLGPHMSDSKVTKGLWQLHTITAVLFFLLTTINQIAVTWWLSISLTEDHKEFVTLKIKKVINVFQVILLLWLFSSLVSELSREATNIIEWWIATLSALYILTSYWDWKEFSLAREE
ncbi:MAG: hypothetical protein V7765_06055 [Oleispira sp.]